MSACVTVFNSNALEALDALVQGTPRLVDLVWPEDGIKANIVHEGLLHTLLDNGSGVTRVAKPMHVLTKLPFEVAWPLITHMEAHLEPIVGPGGLVNILTELPNITKTIERSDLAFMLHECCGDTWALLEYAFLPNRHPELDFAEDADSDILELLMDAEH